MLKPAENDPPRLGVWILKIVLPFHAMSHGVGDYEEVFHRMVEQKGRWKAHRWYWLQLLRHVFPFIVNSLYWRFVMFKNYIKIAFRNVMKHRAYAAINIIGLALGMSSCILIVSYILYELSYEQFHDKADRIYRLGLRANMGGEVISAAMSNAPTALALCDEYPEVQNTVRFYSTPKATVQYKDKHFYEDDIFYTDASFFDVFSFPLIAGDPNSALKRAYTAVITEALARKYFGDEDPIGKILKLNNSDEYTVTGILERIPPNTHLNLNMLCSFQTLYVKNETGMAQWVPFNYFTYILLQEGVDFKILEGKFPAFIDKNMSHIRKALGGTLDYFLQPLTRIHLHSHLAYDNPGNSDITYIYIFGSIAAFILIIACVNFMNLATARSEKRSREIGIRKVLGSNRGKLITQFIGESMLYSFFALFIALIIVQLTLPLLNSMSGRELGLHYPTFPWFIPSFIGLALFMGFVSGTYPAIFLSGFRPMGVLKHHAMKIKRSLRFRNILVVFQFAISIMLIVGTGMIVNQLTYMKNKKLGFDKENVVVLRTRDSRIRDTMEPFKSELKQYSGISDVGVSTNVPVGLMTTKAYVPEGHSEDQRVLMYELGVDQDFIPTLGMEIVAGRNFSEDISTDADQSVIINETAAKQLGWDDPIGKIIYEVRGASLDRRVPKTVIGLVKDFHTHSLHREIDPIYISHALESGVSNYVSVRIRAGDLSKTMDFLKKKWMKIETHRPFDYFFLDDRVNGQYRAEEKLSAIFSYFTAFAIIIAAMGLFGLASYAAEQRTKEIGIRKVLGSSIGKIILLLVKDFTKWVIIANILAWPVAYFVLHRWLQNFAYRVDIKLWLFVLSGLLALMVALFTVSYQAIRAAGVNPVKSLRYE